MPTSATGLVIKRTSEIREDIRTALRSAFGEAVRLGSESVFGQIIDPIAQQLGELYSLLQALYDARNVQTAEGVQLDNVNNLVGVARLEAEPSTVDLTLGGTAGTTIPAGSQVRVGSDGPIFETTESATLDGGGSATGVAAESVDTGPIEADAGAIDTIVTSVAGWSSVTNPATAVLGRNVESDSEYRIRRANSLQIIGSATDQARRALLEQVDGVLAAAVISNRTQSPTDSLGIPLHYSEAVVYPNTVDPLEVGRAIWRSLAAGGATYGSETVDVVDDQDYVQTLYFSFATELLLYVTANVTTNSEYPIDGDTLVEEAILDYVATLSIGDNVFPVKILCAVIDEVPGIDELEILARINAPAVPGDVAPIEVDLDSIALGDAARVTVSS